MIAPKQCKQSFNAQELNAMDWAYRAAVAKLDIRDPKRADAVKTFLRHKVVKIAQFGVTDPVTLRDRVLDLMPPLSAQFGKRHHSGRRR